MVSKIYDELNGMFLVWQQIMVKSANISDRYRWEWRQVPRFRGGLQKRPPTPCTSRPSALYSLQTADRPQPQDAPDAHRTPHFHQPFG
jgi:hypothetical protein